MDSFGLRLQHADMQNRLNPPASTEQKTVAFSSYCFLFYTVYEGFIVINARMEG